MKKPIAIMLLVVLTISAMGATLAPNAKATPENAKINSYSWYTYPASSYGSGDLIVVGEVQNVGSTVLDHVSVHGIVYTTDGQPQADSYTTAFVENMLPQQKAPFYMDITVDNAVSGNMTWVSMIDHIEFAVFYANDTDTQPYSDLTIMANTSYPDPSRNGLYTVTGIVKNTGTQASPNMVWVVTTFYNASGTVVALNETAAPYITSSLAPDASFSFSATPDDYTQLTSQITSHSVIVQSRQTTTEASPTPTLSQSPNPSATTSPQSSESPAQSAQTQQSSTSPELIYAIIGAVVAVVIIVVALLFLRKKR